MTPRSQIADIIFGSVFLFIGSAAGLIAAIRRSSGARLFVWLGIWSALYGGAQLSQSPMVVETWPRWLQRGAPYASAAMTSLLVVFGSLAFFELSLGRLRQLIRAAAGLGLAIAVARIASFGWPGLHDQLAVYNNLLAAGVLVALTVVVTSSGSSRRFLVLGDSRVLAIGTFLFAVEALYANLSGSMGLATLRILDHLGFAILLVSFAYVALQVVFTNERRLLAVESELAIAREIQTSILPRCIPELQDLSISAAYLPMTAVAGDFYEFIPIDDKRLGILVADVSGHGVPAALIASMIKVAAQSVVPCAHDPAAVLRGLNRALSGQLRGQFVTAAYLWMDLDRCIALYSAAGHPALLRWRQGQMESIESNGLLFGVIEDCDDYPVRSLEIERGDRFLLYTDGVTESENAAGDFFGERKLEQIVRANQSCTASELSNRLLDEIRSWQPASKSQQD